MPSSQKDAAIRKRQQIQDSSKKMFLWVAGASVIVGFALVVSWFLVRQIIFKDKVISRKNETVNVLKSNNQVAPDLTSDIRVLETNEALRSVRINDKESALQVILDALPADDNKLALGASLQNKLVGGTPNVTLESFLVGDDTNTINSTKPALAVGVEVMPFQMVVSSSDANALKELVKRLEASIRTIDVDSMTIERNDTRITLTVNGHAYYMPAVTLRLTDEVVKP